MDIDPVYRFLHSHYNLLILVSMSEEEMTGNKQISSQAATSFLPVQVSKEESLWR